MKKWCKKIAVWLFAATALLIVGAVSVSAATNPLAKIPGSITKTLGKSMIGLSEAFFVESSKPIEITATSSNPNVVTVSSSANQDADIYGKYLAGVVIDNWKAGTSTIKVTAKIGGKTYTRTCKVTCIYKADMNPLDTMPKSERNILAAPTHSGCDYITPVFSVPIQFSVKSSNPAVIKVEKYSWKPGEWQKGYCAGYMMIPQKAGSATITATLKVNGKTYKKSCKYTNYAYVCPFTELKIGKKSFINELKKHAFFSTKIPVGGKLAYKLKSGYKIKEIMATVTTGKSANGAPLISYKKIKNGSLVPKGTTSLQITVTNVKKKLDFQIRF